jgi:hypothetical protein
VVAVGLSAPSGLANLPSRPSTWPPCWCSIRRRV